MRIFYVDGSFDYNKLEGQCPSRFKMFSMTKSHDVNLLSQRLCMCGSEKGENATKSNFSASLETFK